MCRNIRPLFNYDPPAGDSEIRAAALQFVRKVSGSTRPSQANQAAFELAVEEIAESVTRLLDGMSTKAPPKDRNRELEKARTRNALRFGNP